MMKICVFVLLTLTASFFAHAKQWQMIETVNKPTARHENGFVAHQGKLYLIGGRRLLNVEVYDPSTKSWSQKKPTPFEMHHITPVSVGDRILVVTGLTGPYPKEPPLSHIWEYWPEEDRWQKTTEIPKSRRRGGAGVVYHNNQVYVVGGISFGHTSGTTNMFDVYDPKTAEWKSLTDAPHIRDHANAVVVDGQLVALGGRNSSYHEPDNFHAFMAQVNNKIDVYDFESGIWKTLALRLPIATGGGGAFSLNGRVYYTAGETGLLPANAKMISFSLTDKNWRSESDLVRARHGTNIAELRAQFYIAVGSGQRGGGPELNSIEVYAAGKDESND